MRGISSDDVPNLSDRELLRYLASLDPEDCPIALIARFALKNQEDES
jgi:hypothetical protein